MKHLEQITRYETRVDVERSLPYTADIEINSQKAVVYINAVSGILQAITPILEEKLESR